MSTAAVAVILSAIGGVCELAGLYLVVKEVMADRKQARELLTPRPAADPPQRSYPGPVSIGPLPGTTRSFAQPGIRGDLRAVAAELDKIETSVFNALVRLKKGSDEDLDGAVNAVEQRAVERDSDLRQALLHVLAEGYRDRLIGACLLFAGILLNLAGSVVSSLS